MSARARSAQMTAPERSKSTTASSSARRASPRRRCRRRAVASATRVRARSYGLGARSCSSSDRANSASACSCSPRSEATSPLKRATSARTRTWRSIQHRPSYSAIRAAASSRRPSPISASIPLGGCLQTGSMKPAASLRRSESLEVLQRRGRLAAVERDEAEGVVAPCKPRIEHRRERELLTGERQRLGVVQLAEESADRPASQQAVHPHGPFVLLLSHLDALGRVVAREQEVPGVRLDVRQQPVDRRSRSLVAALDGVVQNLERKLPRAVVLADAPKDVGQRCDRPILENRRCAPESSLDLRRPLERLQTGGSAGNEFVEDDSGGRLRKDRLVPQCLGDHQRGAAVLGSRARPRPRRCEGHSGSSGFESRAPGSAAPARVRRRRSRSPAGNTFRPTTPARAAPPPVLHLARRPREDGRAVRVHGPCHRPRACTAQPLDLDAAVRRGRVPA